MSVVSISEFLFQEQPATEFIIKVEHADFISGAIIATVYPNGEPTKALEYIIFGKTFSPVVDGKEDNT